MPAAKPSPVLTIRDLKGFADLRHIEAVEREVWGVTDLDITPLTLAIACQQAGSIWIGAFDGAQLVGFAFALLGLENGRVILHSHLLAVRPPYRDRDLGYKLKLAQRERALALRIHDSRGDSRGPGLRIERITWTFDPLQSRNAHLNFAKLGVVSDRYEIDFYGPATSSVLHQNGTDRLWVQWPIAARRVQSRLQGKDKDKENRPEMLDALSTLTPLLRFNGDGKPARGDLSAAVSRQRIAIEIPGEIASVERKNPPLAQEWRQATRWAFTEALKAGFIVAEFCRTVRGQQGPGVYLLEKGSIEEYVPELASGN